MAPAGASAFYGHGAQIVSADFNRLEQGDDGTDFAAISADGRYVAIQTRARNFFADDDPDPPGQFRRGGIFRFDLETRELEKVADGDFRNEATNALVLRGAQSPSISGNGRYVAFSTAQRLLVADTNANVDVYVRDMEIPIGSSGAFDLVSAKDGGDVPASYAPPGSPVLGGNPGAEVARAAAISLDGSKVAFRTTAPASDLPDRPSIDTSSQQVFVRDRATDDTILVTRTMGSGDPAGGATGPAGISGDGSTVIWTGQNAPLQTPFVIGENADLPGFSYYLWQRFADGPTAPTKRITGVSDPEDPGCRPLAPVLFDEFQTGPCFGPLARAEIGISPNSGLLPAISADGFKLAFLTNSNSRPTVGAGIGLDLFITDMSTLTRKESTVELTREGSAAAESEPLESVAISADGNHLAIVTARTRFTLPALAQVGQPRTVADTQDVYVVDLGAHTVERATRSFAGGDTDSAVVGEPTISGDGGRVAFISFAGNLFFGDANQRSDAFVVARRPEPEGREPEDRVGDDGPAGTIEVEGGGPQLGVKARSKAGGEVVLTVSVPAAGGVKAVARARAGEPRSLRTLATGTTRASGAARSAVRLVLRPVARYRAELREREAIPGRAVVTYVASRGGRRASAAVRVVFRQVQTRRNGRAPAKK